MSRQLFFPVPILVVILLTLYAGCRKDDLYTTGIPPGPDFSIRNLKTLVSSRSGDALSIRSGGGDSTDITLTDDYAIQPDWSIRIVYRDTQGDTIRTLVPCRTGAPFQLLGPQGTTFLQFQRGVNALNNTPVITYKVVTMIPEELNINFERFSGVAIVHDINSLMATAYKVSHDTIRGQGQINFGSLVNWQSSLDIRDNPGKALPCYSFRDPWYERVWDFLNWFINPGNSPYGFSFGEIGSGGSWNNLNDTRPPGGSGSGGSGTGSGGTNPGNNNSGVIVDPNAWANVDFELAMKFGNDNGAYDYMVALKQQAQYDNAKKLRYYRILNFYKHLLTIPPDINQNLAYAPGPCPHGGCQPIDIFDYFIRTQSPFANQVILHFTGNTNLTSMALYSWAWKINDGLSMEKIDEYIAAHPELHGPFQSVGYTLPQITNNSLYNNIIAKFDKLRFLDELCALDNHAISELLLADNHGNVIGDAYDFYFAQGQTITARNFIRSYLSGFRRATSDQFEYFIQHWNNTYNYLVNIGLTAGTTNFIEALNWLRSHLDVYLAISNEDLLNDNSEFARWGIQYFVDHPNTTLKQFKNWFMGTPEGYDGEYDAAYWDDPNLTFPSQNLPSWSSFEAAFPKKNGGFMPSTEVYELVGGPLYASHLANPAGYSNACAIRVSRALNYSGVVIPNLSGKTEKGSDGKYYFLSAANLNAWMKKTFGSPSYHFTGAEGGIMGSNFPTLLGNKKGIYIMIPNYPAYFASGHADIWDGTDCNGGCYFNIEADLPNNKKQGVSYINLWSLN